MKENNISKSNKITPNKSQFEKVVNTVFCIASILPVLFVGFIYSSISSAKNLNVKVVEQKFTFDLFDNDVELNKEFCVGISEECYPVSLLTKRRVFQYQASKKDKNNYIEFPLVIDFLKAVSISKTNSLSKMQQRKFIQRMARILNEWSIKIFVKENNIAGLKGIKSIRGLLINNSATITHRVEGDNESSSDLVIERTIVKPHSKWNESDSSTPVLGIIDSGISSYHKQLSAISVEQFNPKDNSFDLKDTGLGHATGILSQLAIAENENTEKGLVEQGHYLSCNGLPNGKYDFILILRCMDWIFLQPRVDVLLNAWLVSEPGCRNEWIHPIAMLFHANTIPVFAAGNYAISNHPNHNNMNFSPANLDLTESGFLLLTVGSIDSKSQRLVSSSFGKTQCMLGHRSNNLHYQANIMALGSGIKVAVPFSQTSFQNVSGTSYSIAFVASTLINLMHKFPNATAKEISIAVLHSAVGKDKEKLKGGFGYGILNERAALKRLKLTISKSF